MVGIVNEHCDGDAMMAAFKAWPDRLSIRVDKALSDPFRQKTLVRAEMLAFPDRVQ